MHKVPFPVVAGADTACPDASVALRFSEITLDLSLATRITALRLPGNATHVVQVSLP